MIFNSNAQLQEGISQKWNHGWIIQKPLSTPGHPASHHHDPQGFS
jgi:hypothetical protein